MQNNGRKLKWLKSKGKVSKDAAQSYVEASGNVYHSSKLRNLTSRVRFLRPTGPCTVQLTKMNTEAMPKSSKSEGTTRQISHRNGILAFEFLEFQN